MPRPFKVYVETSVWNVYFESGAEKRFGATRNFFDTPIPSVLNFYISPAVLDEVEEAPSPRRLEIGSLMSQLSPRLLPRSEAVETLAQAYLAEKALPMGSWIDALHIAYASAHELDLIVSWNLRHIANTRRQAKVQAINLTHGFTKPILLITPLEVVENVW